MQEENIYIYIFLIFTYYSYLTSTSFLQVGYGFTLFAVFFAYLVILLTTLFLLSNLAHNSFPTFFSESSSDDLLIDSARELSHFFVQFNERNDTSLICFKVYTSFHNAVHSTVVIYST